MGKISIYDYKSTIIEQFEDVASNYPNKCALAGEANSLTYFALSNYVVLVSSHLRMDSSFVYLLFEHDISMVVAMLSVLKAKKAYISLDPDSPIERLEYILSDSKGGVILVDNCNYDLALRLASISKVSIHIINIDTLLIKGNKDFASGECSDVAYVLYTSGSTGRPKGVLQNNRNVMHFISKYSQSLGITASDQLTLFSTYCFDASVMDIYGALLNGATLNIYKVKKIGSIDKMKYWIYENNITIFHSVPTLYRYFISKIGSDSKLLSSIRCVVMGGESVLINDVDTYKKHFSDACIFVNGLGPTESTVTLQYFIDMNTKITTATVPVGYPIDETNVYILDDEDKEVGVNEIGELVYNSDYLALGYLNIKEETDKVFVIDPVKKYGRAFKTGDLAKRNENGLIEFCGRRDFQIKIRGYRIELNEIESMLDKHIDILKSVVMPITLNNNGPEIIAYYKLVENTKTSEIDLQEYLKEYLPEYMIPSYFYPLEEFPLTTTGKIDRKRIISHLIPSNLDDESNLQPRDVTEQKIYSIWENVLNSSGFGIRTAFVKAGGNSLLATSIAIQLEDNFDIELELSVLTKLNTIEDLANYVKEVIV